MTEETVGFLAGLRLEQRTVECLPENLVPASLEEGYVMQRHLVERLCAARGGAPIGYKVALTSETAQSLVGYPAPVFGHMLSHSHWRSGATLAASQFTTRIIETEFAFRFAMDVPPEPQTRESIVDYIGALVPSIELVDHRFAGLDRMDAPTLAADNAIHGGWIESAAQTRWQHLDLAHHTVSLRVNGAEILTGAGDRVLGHPLEVLAWLANTLPQHGLALKAGDFVTTGLATDGIYAAQAGDEVIADFGSLGQVAVFFE